MVTDQATGTLAARYKYDAFGAQEQTVSLTTQPYGFTGREFDRETGLYYYRARTYDPNVGRFLQSDPLGFAAGDTNLYAYTWNDPANWTDPSGLTGSGSYGRNTGSIVKISRDATRRVGKSAKCLARKIGTFLSGLGRELAAGRDISRAKVSQGPGCRTRVRAPKCGCGGRGGNRLAGALAFAPSNFSFPEGTEVLTPEGPVAIETLREGDLVIARNEDTGVSGVFPVTAVMGRQASEVLWLTLENTEGEVTRMGVTPTHPLFIVEAGWGEAGALVPGDAIRDKDLQALTVLAVEVDPKPQMVHNLEIADAHTYFAGELEAWGHNSGFNPPNPPNPSKVTVNGVCYTSNFPNDHGPAHVHVSGGGSSTRTTFSGGGVDGTDRPLTPKQRKGLCDPKVRKLLRNAAKWVKYYANR